jgi:hypothetical protein
MLPIIIASLPKNSRLRTFLTSHIVLQEIDTPVILEESQQPKPRTEEELVVKDSLS